MLLNTQWPLKIQSIFPNFYAYTHFFHTYLPFSKPSSGNICGEDTDIRTGQATGVGCRRWDWLAMGAAGPSQDILLACYTKYPWKSPMLGCTDGCQVVPRLLPRYLGTNPKSENWKWQSMRATQKHNAPPTAPWKSFSHMLFGKMMIPCYVMAGLGREAIKRRGWFWIKRKLFRLIQQVCPSCTQTRKYKLSIHPIYWSNGPN